MPKHSKKFSFTLEKYNYTWTVYIQKNNFYKKISKLQ